MLKKQLIYLSNARLPTEKANGFQIMKMCQAFARQQEVTLIHPRRRQPLELQGKTPWNYYGIRASFTIQPLPTVDLEPHLPQYWYQLQVASHLVATLFYTLRLWNRSDVVFFSRDRFSMSALLALRPLVKATLVFEAHLFPSRSAARFVALFKRLDRLVVITHQLKRLFVEAGMPKEKVLVAPDAVDLSQFQISENKTQCRQRLGLPLERPIIGYVGRFQAMGMEKGIPELIQAMKYLLEWQPDNPPLLLCVGGPMESVPHYKRIAQQEGIRSDCLFFHDRVPNSEVPYWMRACDIGTIPWGWNKFSAYYTSPMKLFEYMAAGTPIVASDLPSLREVLRHEENAILVAPDDAFSLAEGLQRLLLNQQLATRLAQQAALDVRKYTWEKRAEQILTSLHAS